MQICWVNCRFYLLVLVVTTFVFIFPFLRAAVKAVSLVRSVPLFFFSLLCCMVCYGTDKDRLIDMILFRQKVGTFEVVAVYVRSLLSVIRVE